MWTEDLFGTKKPIIAMCHLQAFPGEPRYDREKGLEFVIEKGRKDLEALQDGGVDGVMFSNEYGLPYQTAVSSVTVISMARVIGELLRDIRVPYGVNVLLDPVKSLELAVATGARFVREIFSGVYASDFGLWNTDSGSTIRHKMAIGAENVRCLYNIVPESGVYLAGRDIESIAKTTVFINRRAAAATGPGGQYPTIQTPPV
jgi:membrane complex biogenesis BtpA family protein